MIYKIVSKLLNIMSNYRLWDYLSYIIFFIIVLAVTFLTMLIPSYGYAQGDYNLNSDKIIYTVDEDFDGKITLPSLYLSCPDNGGVQISFKVKVNKFISNNSIEISILDTDNNESKHQFKRLFGDEPVVINYSQDLGDLDLNSLLSYFVADYPYSAMRRVNYHGKFNKGMVLELYDLKAYSDLHNQCLLKWAVPVNQ